MSVRRARIRGNKWMAYPMLGLGISVGKLVHEGNDFEAAVDMIAELNKPCLIRLSDTLQRHNLMADGMDAQDAWEKSRIAGDAWLERHAVELARLPFVPVIERWDNVINDPDFENVLTAFSRSCPIDPLFSGALSEDVGRFLSRRSYATHADEVIHAECSRAFILEELAGQTILGRRYTYAGFYPGTPPKVLELVRDGKIAGAPKGLENTAFIRFSLESKPHPANQGALLQHSF